MADLVLVGLDVLHQAQLLQVRHHLVAGLVAIKAGVCSAVVVDPAIKREDVDHFQVVALAAGVVVRVVPRRDLHAACAELPLDQQTVGDDRDGAVLERQENPVANQVLDSGRRPDGPRSPCRPASSPDAWWRWRGRRDQAWHPSAVAAEIAALTTSAWGSPATPSAGRIG